FLVLGTALLAALPEPDGPHLRQRADRQPRAAAHVLDSRHERRRHGPESYQHDAELSPGGGDVPAGLRCHDYGPFRVCKAGACPGSVSRERGGRGIAGSRAIRATYSTRCTTVTAVAAASTTTIQNSNAPRFPAPRNMVGAPSSSTPPQCARPRANAAADATITPVPRVVMRLGRTCRRISRRASGSSRFPKPSRTCCGMTIIAGGK